jgi:hypothetical protein
LHEFISERLEHAQSLHQHQGLSFWDAMIIGALMRTFVSVLTSIPQYPGLKAASKQEAGGTTSELHHLPISASSGRSRPFPLF